MGADPSYLHCHPCERHYAAALLQRWVCARGDLLFFAEEKQVPLSAMEAIEDLRSNAALRGMTVLLEYSSK